MRTIDLNADIGEGMPHDAALFALVSSASIACGGHAGDAETMRTSLALARKHGVRVGAHPGWDDRAGFGRIRQTHPLPFVQELIRRQLQQLLFLAKEQDVQVHYVKLHGALSNQAAEDPVIAAGVAEIVAQLQLSWMVMPHTAMHDFAVQHHIPYICEGFADRTYQPNGLLTPRSVPDSQIHEAIRVATRAVHMAERQALPLPGDQWLPTPLGSLCLHGDNPQALAIAKATRIALETAGWRVGASPALV